MTKKTKTITPEVEVFATKKEVQTSLNKVNKTIKKIKGSLFCFLIAFIVIIALVWIV